MKLLAVLMRIPSQSVSKPKTRQVLTPPLMTQVLSHSLNSSVSVRRPLVKLLALLMRIPSPNVPKPKTRQVLTPPHDPSPKLQPKPLISVRRPLVKLLALLMRIPSQSVSKPKTRQVLTPPHDPSPKPQPKHQRFCQEALGEASSAADENPKQRRFKAKDEAG